METNNEMQDYDEIDYFNAVDFSSDGLNKFKPNIILFKMTNVLKSIESLKLEEQDCITVEFGEYYTAVYGYRVSCSVNLMREKIEMNIALRQGAHDDILDWPFPFSVEMTLMNQADELSNKTVLFTPPHQIVDTTAAISCRQSIEAENESTECQSIKSEWKKPGSKFCSEEGSAVNEKGLKSDTKSVNLNPKNNSSENEILDEDVINVKSKSTEVVSKRACAIMNISCDILTNVTENSSDYLRNDTLYFQYKFISNSEVEFNKAHDKKSLLSSANNKSLKKELFYIPKSVLLSHRDNFHIMQIRGIRNQLNLVVDNLQVDWKQTEQFYTNQCGYQVEVTFLISFDHLCLAFKLLPGSFDQNLKWPFKKMICITLINQVHSEQQRVCKFNCIPVEAPGNNGTWLRCKDSNNRQTKICSVDEVREIDGFIRNDSLLIKVKPLHFE